jgi:hypothetical protein
MEEEKSLGPGDLSTSPKDGPFQPILQAYPSKEQTGRKRSFRADWFRQHPWLEYSVMADAVFCFACRHFPLCDKSTEPAFTSGGFSNWKKAHGAGVGFLKHENCDVHNNAMIMWTEYKSLKSRNVDSVVQLQSDAAAKQIAENRLYVKTVAEVLLLTATQNIAQRGHRETNFGIGDNPGNFRKILQLVMRHDKTVSERFMDGSLAKRYTSKDIQNEILDTLAEMVREQIIEEVKESIYFSVLVDETKDVSHKEQISFVLRYFAHKQVHESFIDFKPADGLNAQSLSALIVRTLTSYGLDIRSCLVGQGYDGASVMSGVNNGVQQIVRQSAPSAAYVHCYAHRLNLILVDACKHVQEASDFFALLQRLYVFTSNSVAHSKWIAVQQSLYPGEPVRQLQRLSDTRWVCRVAACRNIRDRLDAVLCTLQDIAAGSNADRRLESRALLSQIDFKFVLLLTLFCDLLGKMQPVSVILQSSSFDLSKAAELIQNLCSIFKDSRENPDFGVSKLFSDGVALCSKCSIDPVLPRKRICKLPNRFADAAVDETVGLRSDIENEVSFRQHIYIPVLDCIISELDRRFSDQSLTVMTGIQALTPKHCSFLDVVKIEEFAQLYKGNLEDLKHEIPQLARMLQRADLSITKMTTMMELICFLEPYKLAFDQLYRLLNIAIVLPVTSAACERSFSKLRYIKNYLRNSMADSRLSSIAVLSVESLRAESLNLDAFVDEFDTRHNNRKLALH